MSRVRGRWLDRWLAALLCIVPVALMAFDWRYHEFWRDEAGAFTLARDVPLDELYGQLRIQGLPPLYFLLLKATSLLLPSPLPLLVLGWLGNSALLLGTYLLLHSISGGARRASLVVTLCFALTYPYAYELGVVVRHYALGLGFGLMCMAYLREALRLDVARRQVWLGTATGALAALTSAHGACVAGGAMLVFGILALLRRGGVRHGWPVLLALPFFSLTLHMAMPWADRVAPATVDAHRGIPFLLRLAPQLFSAGAMPSDWWRVEYVPLVESWSGGARSWAFIFLLGAFVLAGATRRASLVELYGPVAVVVGWIPLLEIVGNHHYGFYRHHVHFAIPALVLLAGWCIDSALAPPAVALLRRLALGAMVPWFLFAQAISVADLAADFLYPFSDTKHHALALPRGAHVVAHSDEYVGMLAWRPDLLFRAATGRGRHIRFQPFDVAWRDRVSASALVREECEVAPGDVFVTSADMAPTMCLTLTEAPLSSLPIHSFNRENFGLWQVDCRCAAIRRLKPVMR